MRQICTIIMALTFAICQAQIFRGGEVFRIGDSDVYWAAVKTRYFKEYVARQEEDCWCWAACIQTILRYNDDNLLQSEIEETIFGSPYNWTASGNEIVEAFNGWRGWKAKSFKQKSVKILIDELLLHGPIIIGTEEHAFLLTHIYYTSNLSPFKVILINPKTAREEVRDWSNFFPAINTIVSLWR